MSKILDKKLSDNLEKLGLTPKEIEVYIYLIQRSQEVGTSKIILSTGLHGQYVYMSLDSLEKKGLVKHAVKNGRKKWSSNPPNRIESLVEEKRIIANQVKDALELLSVKPNDQEFEVFQGEEQFLTNEFNMIEEANEGDTVDIIGGKEDVFMKLLGERRREYNAKGVEKKIEIRFIGTEEQREYLEKVKRSRTFFNYRIMPGYNNSNISTSIHKRATLFQIYGDPVLVFKLKSEAIASNYRTFFDSLWNLCKE